MQQLRAVLSLEVLEQLLVHGERNGLHHWGWRWWRGSLNQPCGREALLMYLGLPLLNVQLPCTQLNLELVDLYMPLVYSALQLFAPLSASVKLLAVVVFTTAALQAKLLHLGPKTKVLGGQLGPRLLRGRQCCMGLGHSLRTQACLFPRPCLGPTRLLAPGLSTSGLRPGSSHLTLRSLKLLSSAEVTLAPRRALPPSCGLRGSGCKGSLCG
mmetsp:Transcript_7166/g.16162  ORF Transcript_7166/g.16162 Transcript_7166/m.16162 type:complete len:212 (-) Transcript_7166:213-848(-)